MKLSVRHEFQCSPERFWEMYWDEAFDKALSAESGVKREIVREHKEGEIIVRRLRFTPEKDLPGPVATLIGSTKLVYEQENKWDPANNVMTWEVIPTVLPGKLTAKGKFRVDKTPSGCVQVVEGDIEVAVRFIGGQIEKAIVEEVRKSYDRTAAICRGWLKQHGG